MSERTTPGAEGPTGTPGALTAGDVMSRGLVTVEADESPLMAWELMRRTHVHHLPVVDRHGHVEGIVSREDLAANWSGGPATLEARAVGELLSGEGRPRVSPDTPLRRVAAVMVDGGCDAVPVIRPDCTLLGLITTVDILTAVAGRRRPQDTLTATVPYSVPTLFRLEPVLPGGDGDPD